MSHPLKHKGDKYLSVKLPQTQYSVRADNYEPGIAASNSKITRCYGQRRNAILMFCISELFDDVYIQTDGR